MISPDFHVNKARIAPEVLAPHRGKWAAFSSDGCTIAASALDLDELENKLAAMGIDAQEVAFAWVVGPDDDDCRLGAEEWQ